MFTNQSEPPQLLSWLQEQRKPQRLRAVMEKERREDFIRQAEEKGFLFSPSKSFLITKCKQQQPILDLDDIDLIDLPSLHLRTIGDIQLCRNLRYCNLSGNYIARFDGLANCPFLTKLDLHDNQISSLPSPKFWKSLGNLKILYLHNNSIGKLESLQNLGATPCLYVLTLFDTPISLRRSYRHHVVNSIWSLKALDFHVISDEEIIEDAKFGGHFGAMDPAFQFDPFVSSDQERTLEDEAASARLVLRQVSQIQAKHSPVLIIQRYIRGYLARKHAMSYAAVKTWAAVAIQRYWRKYKGLKYTYVPPKPSRQDSRLSAASSQKASSAKKSPVKRPKLKRAASMPMPQPQFMHSRQNTLDFDTYLQNCRPGSLSPSANSEGLDDRVGKLPHFDQMDVINQSSRSTPTSRQRSNLWIDLTKLEAASQLVPIVSSRSIIDGIDMPQSYHSFVDGREPLKTIKSDKDKVFSKDKIKKRKENMSARRMLGTLSESFLDRERLESSDSQDEESRVKFRISGLKSVLYKGDFIGKLYLEKREAGKDIRLAHKNVIDKMKSEPEVKLKKKKRINLNQKLFARIHGTMGVACLRAVQEAYKDREKSEMLARKVDYVMSLREERDQAREQRMSYLEEKRHEAMRKHDRDSLYVAEAIQQQKSQKIEELEKKMEKRLKSSGHSRNLCQDQVFTANFIEQHTSISKALLKHDRHTKTEDSLRSNQFTVKNEREQQRKQGELVQRYLEHRKLMRQAQVAVEKAALDTKILQEANENFMESRNRVVQQKQKVKMVKAFYPLPKTATDPVLPAVPQEGKPDRWETLIMMYDGRVGNHPTLVGNTN